MGDIYELNQGWKDRKTFLRKYYVLLIGKFYFSVPNLEEEVAKLPDKDGWIRINEFMKFAMPLDICKIEFHDRVFQKVDYEAEEKKRKEEAKKESKAKVKILISC